MKLSLAGPVRGDFLAEIEAERTAENPELPKMVKAKRRRKLKTFDQMSSAERMSEFRRGLEAFAEAESKPPPEEPKTIARWLVTVQRGAYRSQFVAYGHSSFDAEIVVSEHVGIDADVIGPPALIGHYDYTTNLIHEAA